MKKLTRLLLSMTLLMCWPLSSNAWNASDHQHMGKMALEDISKLWHLDQQVPVHPLQDFLTKLVKLQPEVGDLWHFSDYLRLNPKIALDHIRPELSGRTTVNPIEILSVYSTDPDDGRDQDLFVRDAQGRPHYAYPDQKWFGSVHGPNSQAFRHIEKPAFSLRHPISTFGVPPTHIGEATERAEIYYQVSQLAFALNEDYWGWRFLAGCLHYIEDLEQPYHAAQITPGLAWKGLKAYFSWGRKTSGLMGTFAHLVSNSHRFFETYVEHPSGRDDGLKQASLAALRGTDVQETSASVEELAKNIRDESNREFPDLVAAVEAASTPELIGPSTFKSDEGAVDNPIRFLTAGPQLTQANQHLFKIVENRFAESGRFIRTLVSKAQADIGKVTPEERLQNLESLLDYHPQALEP
jgi:hypothetical protein